MAQRMPLPLTVSCFSKIQTGFTFLVLAHPGSPGQRAVKRVCVCVCVCGHARHSHEVDWLQFANWSSVQFSSSAAVNAPLHTDHEARGDLQQNAERENTQNNRQRRDRRPVETKVGDDGEDIYGSFAHQLLYGDTYCYEAPSPTDTSAKQHSTQPPANNSLNRFNGNYLTLLTS